MAAGFHRDQRDDRAEHQGAQHEKSLEEVRPADGIEASEEGVENDNGGSDDHGDSGIHVKNRLEEVSAGDDAGGGVDAVDDDKDERGDDLQRLVFRQEAVGEKLGNGDGVVGSDGEAAQLRRDKDPSGNGAAEKADGDPHLTHARQIDGTRQTHEHPRAHVGGSRAESGHQTVHISPAEEVLLFALALFGFDKEEDAYSYDKHEVKGDCAQFDGVQD